MSYSLSYSIIPWSYNTLNNPVFRLLGVYKFDTSVLPVCKYKKGGREERESVWVDSDKDDDNNNTCSRFESCMSNVNEISV